MDVTKMMTDMPVTKYRKKGAGGTGPESDKTDLDKLYEFSLNL